MEKEGQCQIVACSGALKNGSLRVIRNGIGIEELGRMDCNGIERLWAIQNFNQNQAKQILVVSFHDETRIQSLNRDRLTEITSSGFLHDEPTLCAASFEMTNTIAQVTPVGIRILDGHKLELKAEWSPEPGSYVTHSAIYKNFIVLSTDGGKLYLFEFEKGQLKQTG